uniref:hypothetical protein n=1 Tax=Undibacterium sp. TaxID=1914977 RepID=UPI00374D4296
MSIRYPDSGNAQALASTRAVTWRVGLPQQILAVLPFTLFFPVAWMYAGVILFLFSLLLSGGYAEKKEAILASPMLTPVLALSLVSCLVGIFLPRPAGEFWSALGHYQTYLFLLLFVCVGAGDWQRKAVTWFLAGAVISASLFYLHFLGLLPATTMTRSYVVYQGNKSILLGILLAVACGWMLNRLATDGEYRWARLFAFAYIAIALLFLSRSRTASLIMVVLCVMIPLSRMKFSWRSVGVLAA